MDSIRVVHISLSDSQSLTRVKKYLQNANNYLHTRGKNIETSHWGGKKRYAYGTSITSVKRGKYVPYLESFSGMEVKNLGIPGGGVPFLAVIQRGQVKAEIILHALSGQYSKTFRLGIPELPKKTDIFRE